MAGEETPQAQDPSLCVCVCLFGFLGGLGIYVAKRLKITCRYDR